MSEFLASIASASEFWAAITGAVVGGVIAFAIQMVALRAAAKDRKEDTAEKKRALGHALLFKMLQIHSHFRAFNGHLNEALALATKAGHKSIVWQTVIPFANLPQKVHFSTDEMAMLLGMKDDDLFNDIVSLDEVHNSTIDIFHMYRERRGTLTAMLQPSAMEGAVGTTFLTEQQMLRLAPLIVELDGVLAQIAVKCARDESHSWNALARLQKTLHEKIGLAYRLEPKSEAELTDRARAVQTPETAAR